MIHVSSSSFGQQQIIDGRKLNPRQAEKLAVKILPLYGSAFMHALTRGNRDQFIGDIVRHVNIAERVKLITDYGMPIALSISRTFLHSHQKVLHLGGIIVCASVQRRGVWQAINTL